MISSYDFDRRVKAVGLNEDYDLRVKETSTGDDYDLRVKIVDEQDDYDLRVKFVRDAEEYDSRVKVINPEAVERRGPNALRCPNCFHWTLRYVGEVSDILPTPPGTNWLPLPRHSDVYRCTNCGHEVRERV